MHLLLTQYNKHICHGSTCFLLYTLVCPWRLISGHFSGKFLFCWHLMTGGSTSRPGKMRSCLQSPILKSSFMLWSEWMDLLTGKHSTHVTSGSQIRSDGWRTHTVDGWMNTWMFLKKTGNSWEGCVETGEGRMIISSWWNVFRHSPHTHQLPMCVT